MSFWAHLTAEAVVRGVKMLFLGHFDDKIMLTMRQLLRTGVIEAPGILSSLGLDCKTCTVRC